MFDFIFVFFFNDRNNIEPDFEREIVFLYICVCRVYDMSYLSGVTASSGCPNKSELRVFTSTTISV